MDDNEVNLGGEGMLVARGASSASLSLGLLLAMLGVFCVMAPMFSGIAVTVMIGVLLLAGGIVQAIFAFQSKTFGEGAMGFLIGGLSVVAAVIILASPAEGLGVLTIVLTAYFVVSGVTDIILSFKVPVGEGKGWMLFNGIVAILLAALIIAQWPVSGLWAVGLVVGLRLMLYGVVLMALASLSRRALTHLQDTRIAVLERHLRSTNQALQQTQTVLADHAVMLLALDNELRKKVSTSDVDPAMVSLNENLGMAREQMQEAAAAAKDEWAKTQDEANDAFDKLRESMAGISKNMRKELGLDKKGPPSGDVKK